MQGKHKVIFDTDPGVDDAIALYFALAHPDIEVVGITTTFGNVSAQQATANALYLSRLAGHDIPVAQGVPEPIYRAPGTGQTSRLHPRPRRPGQLEKPRRRRWPGRTGKRG